MDDMRLARLLCMRLCHDLVGPVTALNNGLELLGGATEDERGDIVALLDDSARRATQRLRVFRAAFGVTGAADSLDDAPALARAMLEGGDIALDWSQAPPDRVTRRERVLQLVLNMVLCASAALPRGGRVAVRFAAADDALGVRVAAAGPIVTVAAAAQDILAGEADPAALDPATVGAYVTGWLARAMGGAVELTRPAPDSIEICATLPADA